MDRKAELEKKRRKLEELRKAREERQKGGSLAGGRPTSSRPPSSRIGSARRQEEHKVPDEDVDALVDALVGPKEEPELLETDTPVEKEDQEVKSFPIKKREFVLSPVQVVADIEPEEKIFYDKETQTEESAQAENVPSTDGQSRPKMIFDEDSEDSEDEDQSDETDVKLQQNAPSKVLTQGQPGAGTQATPTLTDEDRKAVQAAPEFAEFLNSTVRAMEKALTLSRLDGGLLDFGAEPMQAISDAKAKSLAQQKLAEEAAAGRGGHDTEEVATGDTTVSFSGPTVRHGTPASIKEDGGVTDLDFSVDFPGLLLSGHRQGATDDDLTGGVVSVWGSVLVDTPERVFECESAVNVAQFTGFHPQLIVGGTHSGQVVLWDLRSRSRMPVQRTPLGAPGCHTFPIFGMKGSKIKGLSATELHDNSRNSLNELWTTSSDGRVCCWDLENLGKPVSSVLVNRASDVESILRTRGGSDQGVTVGSSCMARMQLSGVDQGSTRSKVSFSGSPLVLGGQDGLISVVNDKAVLSMGSASATGQNTASRGQTMWTSADLKGHAGPITAVAANPSPGMLGMTRLGTSMSSRLRDMGNEYDDGFTAMASGADDTVSASSLLLSASVDWNVGLWVVNNNSTAAVTGTASGRSANTAGAGAPAADLLEPVTFMGLGDYVTAVEWSPSHPSVFATADAEGCVAIWDLARKGGFEGPAHKRFLSSGGGVVALNSLQWSPDGTSLAVGDIHGQVCRLNVNTAGTQTSQGNAEGDAQVMMRRVSELAKRRRLNARAA
eukprot:Clim_evm44s251 gene=Clim_evmTU44s251